MFLRFFGGDRRPETLSQLGRQVEGRAGQTPAPVGSLEAFRTPTEKNHTRVVLSEAEYQALLGVSRQFDWRFHVALVLAHETGHRIGAIRQLRWSDIDLDGGGWHSLRRKFASDLMDQPLKVLCELGGWKTAKTVLQCYQRADEAQLREALESRRRVPV